MPRRPPGTPRSNQEHEGDDVLPSSPLPPPSLPPPANIVITSTENLATSDIQTLTLSDHLTPSEHQLPLTGVAASRTNDGASSSLVGPRSPNSNLEALYLHQVPLFRGEEMVVPRNAPRHSGPPPPPSGLSTTSTDKAAHLVEIMRNDERLLKEGIQIKFDNQLVSRLNEDLRARLRCHADEGFLEHWKSAIEKEYDFLTDEEEVLTNEPTITGVFRAHLYAHCNNFVKYKDNFVRPTTDVGDPAPVIKMARWGDPPTTVGAVADVASWESKTAQSCGEHKREVVCTNAHLAHFSSAASRFTAGVEGIGIRTQGDKLEWTGLETVPRDFRHKIQLFIIQV